jgi:hypothetical protein
LERFKPKDGRVRLDGVAMAVLVVEPDYLPDSEVLAFSHVYTP